MTSTPSENQSHYFQHENDFEIETIIPTNELEMQTNYRGQRKLFKALMLF